MAADLQELRKRVEQEPVAAFLGLRLLELSEGHARVAMQVRPEFINFNGMAFGGIIAAVADQAFACATNSVITPNVATQCNIHFLAAAAAGDELTAECRVVKSGKRVCVSEITVTNQHGKLIAQASGTTIPLI
jgi:acyl-CoA thioesterase